MLILVLLNLLNHHLLVINTVDHKIISSIILNTIIDHNLEEVLHLKHIIVASIINCSSLAGYNLVDTALNLIKINFNNS